MAHTVLTKLLDTFRHAVQTEREKSTYFEELDKTYPLELFCRVVTVSLETMKIVTACRR